MSVWVVTEEDFSQEGLEGAFDIFVGVAATPLDALGIIERAAGLHPGGRHPSRITIGKGYHADYYDRPGYNDENAVSLETWSPRYDWIGGKQVERPEGYWSHHTTWHVIERDVAGAEDLDPSATPPGSTGPAGVRPGGSSAAGSGAASGRQFLPWYAR